MSTPNFFSVEAFPNFLDEPECDTLLALAQRQTVEERGQGVTPDSTILEPHEREVVAAFEASIAKVAGCPCHGLEMPAKFKVTNPVEDEEAPPPRHMHRVSSLCLLLLERPGLPRSLRYRCCHHQGLHLDTHNDERKNSKHIFASVILYLNTVGPDGGGETVFPNNAKAGARLLQLGITHTEVKLIKRVHHSTGEIEAIQPRAAGVLLEAAEAVCECEAVRCETSGGGHYFVKRSPNGASAIVPQKGLAIIFYTRSALTGGAVDPSSWHGGASVSEGHQKWILQKFKMVPQICLKEEEPTAELAEAGIAQLACRLAQSRLAPGVKQRRGSWG